MSHIELLLNKYSIDYICEKLSIHKGTFRRWVDSKKIPENYNNDINFLLNKQTTYHKDKEYRQKDQFYTNKKISLYCYKKLLENLKKLNVNIDDYTFIEPSAGCCNFFELLPQDKRIGIDIDVKNNKNLIEKNYLDFIPNKNNKYIVFGNPPFGLRGNLALRFINHSSNFADIVAFILPPLFNSDGKGNPKNRVKDYKLFHSENLPINSFIYPNGRVVNVSTVFQVWTKINKNLIKEPVKKTCNNFIKVYSLSNGKLPSQKRNVKMIDNCDFYLPSTCFNGMKLYNSFNELPNNRGYGIKLVKQNNEIEKIIKNTNWKNRAFLGTNASLNLRKSLIENVIIEKGFYDG